MKSFFDLRVECRRQGCGGCHHQASPLKILTTCRRPHLLVRSNCDILRGAFLIPAAPYRADASQQRKQILDLKQEHRHANRAFSARCLTSQKARNSPPFPLLAEHLNHLSRLLNRRIFRCSQLVLVVHDYHCSLPFLDHRLMGVRSSPRDGT